MKTRNIVKLGKALALTQHWNKQIKRTKGINGLDFNERDRIAESLLEIEALLVQVTQELESE